MLDCLRFQAAKAAPIVALPVLSGCSDHHVTDDGGLVGFTKAAGRHATCNGPCGLDVDVRSISEALPPCRYPGKVRSLQGLIHEAVSWELPPPLVGARSEGSIEADVLQQPPETEEGPVLDRALPDLSEGCIAPHPPDESAALPPLAESDPDRISPFTRKDKVHVQPDLREPRAPVGGMQNPSA